MIIKGDIIVAFERSELKAIFGSLSLCINILGMILAERVDPTGDTTSHDDIIATLAGLVKCNEVLEPLMPQVKANDN